MRILRFLFLGVSLSCGLAVAQQATPSPNDTLISPEVLANRRVAFRIYAPKASDVTLNGDWVTQGRGTAGALARDAQGVNGDFETRNAKFFADPAATNARLKLFWIAAGNNDRVVTDGPRKLSETLTRRGIRHEFHETEGGHTWINWRRYLHDYAQRLFR